MRALAAFLAGMLAIGAADCARADDPPVVPECAALIPEGAEPCERDGAWERCPMYVPAAMRCELRVLHRDLTRHRAELLALTTSHQAAEAAVVEAERGSRTRATLVALLATAGASALVGGIVAGEPLVVLGGAAGVSVAVLIARW